jgi:putative nucleotidyltransferase with HDIG domain
MKSVAPKAPFEWWALYLRGLAVLFGLSVLLIGTQTDRVTPSTTSAILLLMLFPAGLLSVLAPSHVGPHVASYLGTILELGIVSLLVGETGGMTSFFFFFYVPVLIWGTAGRGLVAGVVGGWVSALGYAAAVGLNVQPAAGILPRAALLMLIGLLVGFLEQRRMEATQSALRGAEELTRRAHVSAQVQATLTAMAGRPLADRARALLERALHLADADFGLVAVVDIDQRLVIEAGLGADGKWRPHGEVLEPGAVVAETMESGLPQIAVDASTDARWVSVFGGDAAGSALLVPLRAGDRSFGVLHLARSAIRLFRDEHLGATYALAETTSASLHDAQMHSQSREFLLSAVNTLAATLEAKDPYAHGHSQRVAANAVAIATEIGLPAEDIERVQWASLLHDIGRIGAPEGVLRKRTPLTDEDRKVIHQHPERGAAILHEMAAFRPLVDIVKHHQEAYDGTGYPDGLAGDAIPLGSRIIRVADAFEAMTSDRPYRKGRPIAEAIGELRGMAGTMLDPEIVDVFVRLLQVRPPFDVQVRLLRER